MSMMESVAYLKGLAKGLDVSEDTKESKLILAIIDVLDEMASSVADVEEMCEELDELVGIIDEDLGNVEEDVYHSRKHAGHGHGHDDCCGGEDNLLYEVTCPKCGEQLEFDLNDVEEEYLDDECDCGCGFDCDCKDGGDCSCGEDCGCNDNQTDNDN